MQNYRPVQVQLDASVRQIILRFVRSSDPAKKVTVHCRLTVHYDVAKHEQ